MNYAASLLKSDKSLKVAEIAGLVDMTAPANSRPHSSDNGKNAVGISKINYLIGIKKAVWSGKKN